jgi:hypothetical protein
MLRERSVAEAIDSAGTPLAVGRTQNGPSPSVASRTAR